MEIRFFSVERLNVPLKYVLMLALMNNRQFVFVRNHNRSTWELPAGHIETGETPRGAACRELIEETGALKFRLAELFDYSVTDESETVFGRIFLAEITEIGELPQSEIGEIRVFDKLPANLTYPDIQPAIIRKAMNILQI